jgi:hypothetical protein
MHPSSTVKAHLLIPVLCAVAGVGCDRTFESPAGFGQPTASAGRENDPVLLANPRVKPGKVRWHRDFAAACAAAKKSGKPVLLFQMMGKLDEQLC